MSEKQLREDLAKAQLTGLVRYFMLSSHMSLRDALAKVLDLLGEVTTEMYSESQRQLREEKRP